jgi:hypothetical protein
MTEGPNRIERVEAELMKAHRATPDAEPAPGWQAGVMREVRASADAAKPAGELLVFTQTLWRFAAAAALVAMLLGAYVWRTGFGPQVELTALLAQDPVGLGTVWPLDL